MVNEGLCKSKLGKRLASLNADVRNGSRECKFSDISLRLFTVLRRTTTSKPYLIACSSAFELSASGD